MDAREIQIIVNSASRDAAQMLTSCGINDDCEERFINLHMAIVGRLIDEIEARVQSSAVTAVTTGFPGATVSSPPAVTGGGFAPPSPPPVMAPPTPQAQGAPNQDALWQQLFAEVAQAGGNYLDLPGFYSNFTYKDGSPNQNPNFVHKQTKTKLWVSTNYPDSRPQFVHDGLAQMGLG